MRHNFIHFSAVKLLILLFQLLLSSTILNAQRVRNCGSPLDLSTFTAEEINSLNSFNNYVNSLPPVQSQRVRPPSSGTDILTRNSTSESVILIPVVVHVVHNTDAQNISDAQIRSQIRILNEDFRRTNTDASLLPTRFSNADIQIQFYLACTDPNGSPTTGIERFRTSIRGVTAGSLNTVKQAGTGLVAWDVDRYLNIWSCNFTDGTLGAALYPFQLTNPSNRNLYGLALTFDAFGNIGPVSTPFNLGRTGTHEIGHCLNLIHIWGDDEAASNTCNGSDQVEDTPNQRIQTFNCVNFVAGCVAGEQAMTMNYMDYSDDRCMYAFTPGQKTRMRANFASGQPLANFQKQEYTITGPAMLGRYRKIGNMIDVVFEERTFRLGGPLPSGAITSWSVGSDVTVIRSTNSSITVRGQINGTNSEIRAQIANAGPCGSVNVSPFGLPIYVDPAALNILPPNDLLSNDACYTIKVDKTGKRLQGMGNNSILQQPSNNATDQVWKLDDRGNGRVSFTVQDGTNRAVQATNGANNGAGLTLGGYAANGLYDWGLQSNPANSNLWRVFYPANNNTWDLEGAATGPVLQIYGNTSESFVDYRSFQFEPASCPTTGGSCNFSPSVVSNVANPGCGQTVQLTANCSGANCDQLTYNWNGTGQTSQSMNVTLPNANGSYSYAVTMSRPGCNNNTTGITLNVSGCGGADPCAAYTVGTQVGYRSPATGDPSVKVVVSDAGGCKRAMWSNGDGAVNRDWLAYITANPGFTISQMATCLKFSDEPCGGRRAVAEPDNDPAVLNMVVSPNPNTGQFTVRFHTKAGQGATLQLTDLHGRAVRPATVITGTGQTHEEVIQLPVHVRGLLFIDVRSGQQRGTQKVLIE